MGRAHQVRAASIAKTAAMKSKIYSRFGKELYVAAKTGVPDPEMNLTLKRKIAEAKANQVPAAVIDRPIEKAKGTTVENYTVNRYEGFGPGASTLIIDCLTDNVNRTITEIKTCFNKAKAKLGVLGSVSFNYNELGILSFTYDDEEKMLEALIEADVELEDIELEDGIMTVYVNSSDFHKAQDAIEELIKDVNFDVCKIAMLPNEYIQLTDEEEIETFNRLIDMLNDVEDVQHIYHNVEIDE